MIDQALTTVAEATNGAAPKGAKKATGPVTIARPDFREVALRIVGLSPYVQNRFSAKAQEQIEATQRAGSTAKKGRAKKARDFEADFAASLYRTEDGGYGIPAPAFRAAAIDACRLTAFVMTRAKMSVFIEADAWDRDDGTPLVRLDGPPKMDTRPVRNSTGVIDIRARGIWPEWRARVRVVFDGGQFTESDVVNLFLRAGRQVGVGEGRPFSKQSHGCGWGTFKVTGYERLVLDDVDVAPLLAQAEDGELTP